MKKRILPVVVLLAAAIAVTVFLKWRNADDGRILLSGNIEFQKVDIAFKVPGKLVELAVAEGADVKRGMLIGRIDKDITERSRDRDAAAIPIAEAQLAAQLTGIEYAKQATASELALRRAELAQAEARLNELRNGARPQELKSARAALDDARALHTQARRDWDRAQVLFKNEDISATQHDQFRTRFDSTAAALKRAEENLALVAEGPRQEQIEQQRAAVARAQAALKLTEAAHLDIRRREQEAVARRGEIERAKVQVTVVDAQLNDTTANSPIDGVVMVKSAEPGETLGAGASVVTLGDIDHPWVRGYVPETKLGQVKLGQKVKVTSDSFPGKVYNGRVSFIASEAEFTPKQIQTKEERVKLVYRIKIDVENPNRELKLNMPVDAELVLEGK
jgi:HlyD family secretion protein